MTKRVASKKWDKCKKIEIVSERILAVNFIESKCFFVWKGDQLELTKMGRIMLVIKLQRVFMYERKYYTQNFFLEKWVTRRMVFKKLDKYVKIL
jgi:hypothetical protein